MSDSSTIHITGFSNAAKDTLREANHTAENQKGIENHKRAAEHFALASKLHFEAAVNHEEGNHAKANECALKASGHASIASDFQLQDAKHHSLEN